MERDCRRLRFSFASAAVAEQFTEVYDMVYERLLLIRLYTSDGAVFDQAKPGVMKSGSVCTISANSHLQVILRAIYENARGAVLPRHAADYGAHMGDDGITYAPKDVKDYIQWMASIQVDVKRCAVGRIGDEDITFCSMRAVKFQGCWAPCATNLEKNYESLRTREDHASAKQAYENFLQMYAADKGAREAFESLSKLFAVAPKNAENQVKRSVALEGLPIDEAKPAVKENGKSKGSSVAERPKLCFRCGESGHIASNCTIWCKHCAKPHVKSKCTAKCADCGVVRSQHGKSCVSGKSSVAKDVQGSKSSVQQAGKSGSGAAAKVGDGAAGGASPAANDG